MRQPERDSQNKTARIGQTEQDCYSTTGYQDMIREQDSRERTTRTGQPGQDRDRTAGTGPGQDSRKRTSYCPSTQVPSVSHPSFLCCHFYTSEVKIIHTDYETMNKKWYLLITKILLKPLAIPSAEWLLALELYSNIVRQMEEKAVIRVFLLRLALSLFPRSFLRAPALASVKARKKARCPSLSIMFAWKRRSQYIGKRCNLLGGGCQLM
jgi:hypothetical protein